MPRFLVIARDNPDGFMAMSPSEAQAVIERYIAWSRSLAERGHLQTSDKLREGPARVLRGGGGATDGPYAEAKEVVGGFWVLTAGDIDEAQELLSDSPHLDFGSLELREIQELERE